MVSSFYNYRLSPTTPCDKLKPSRSASGNSTAPFDSAQGAVESSARTVDGWWLVCIPVEQGAEVYGAAWRVSVEDSDTTAEGLSVTSEGLRVMHKALKVTGEGHNSFDEGLRVTTDTLDVTDEALGLVNGSLRVTTDTLGVTDEGLGLVDESLRVTDESLEVIGEGRKGDHESWRVAKAVQRELEGRQGSIAGWSGEWPRCLYLRHSSGPESWK